MKTNSINAFFSISYIPFLLPVILSGFGFSNQFYWFNICILIAFCSFIATFFCQRALIAGPGIAAITIIADKILPQTNNINDIVTIIIITSVLIFITVQLKIEQSLLSIISKKTKMGFKSGIGLMFIISSLHLVPASEASLFIALLLAFFLFRKNEFAIPGICLIMTIIANFKSGSFSANAFEPPKIFFPSWHNNLLSGIITLFSTMLIDTTITANTLNPGKEYRGLNLTASFSAISAFFSLLPCSMYLETLVLPDKKDLKSAYYCSIMMLIIGLIGQGIYIPKYLAAALLAKLGLKIFISTKPSVWLRRSPQAILVAIIIASLKSFLIAITVGVTIESFNEKFVKHKLIWIISLWIGSLLVLM